MRKLWKPSRRLFLAGSAGLIASPAIVRAGSLSLLGAGAPAAGGGGSGITFSGTYSAGAAPGFAAYNFPGVNFGPASADRIIYVGFASDNSVYSAPTIGGVTGTLAESDGSAHNNVGLWYANVPTGTSGSIVFNSTGASTVSMVVGALHGQSGGGSATPVNPANYPTLQPQPVGPLSLTVPTGGIGICVAGYGAGAVASAPTFTWTNTTSSAGDETAYNTTGNTSQISMSHTTATASVSASSTQDLSYGGTMACAAMAP